MRRLVIGDVHGHYAGLMSLLELVGLTKGDRLYFLGDLIDRGEKSAAVVDWVMAEATESLLGNHEYMCLEAHQHPPTAMAWRGWLANGGSKTLTSYADGVVAPAHLAWMAQRPPYLDLGEVWLVHAGVDPDLPLHEQGVQEFCWIREPFFGSPKPFFPDKTIITGHTITFMFPGVEPGQLAAGAGWLNLETGAYHPKSGWLTALDIDGRQVYQTNVFSGQKRVRALEEITVYFEVP
ncbi:MAG: metallophosphoesterase [Pseudanabaenaceae cyanobacterium]